eukprot:gene13356-17915_t
MHSFRLIAIVIVGIAIGISFYIFFISFHHHSDHTTGIQLSKVQGYIINAIESKNKLETGVKYEEQSSNFKQSLPLSSSSVINPDTQDRNIQKKAIHFKSKKFIPLISKDFHSSNMENNILLKPKDSFEEYLEQNVNTNNNKLNANVNIGTTINKIDTKLSNFFLKCSDMKEKHAVEPGVSWGNLPQNLQRFWTQMNCDELLSSKFDESTKDSSVTLIASSASHYQPDVPGTDLGSDSNNGFISKTNKKGKKKKNKINELIGIPKEFQEWCFDAKEKYGVKILQSWGTLPKNEIEVWKQRKCDLVFTYMRMYKKDISSCHDSTIPSMTSIKTDTKSLFSFISTTTTTPKQQFQTNNNNSLPLIAIMAATTTRKVNNPSTKNLALFTILLPSVIRTLDCGFRYSYVLGYDKGDPFYDTKEGMDSVKKWFYDNIQNPLLENGISIVLLLVKVNNTLKKPGPVFIEMARAAYRNGAEYFYRINDDTELLSNWPLIFVKSLASLKAPYGVIGPNCN